MWQLLRLLWLCKSHWRWHSESPVGSTSSGRSGIWGLHGWRWRAARLQRCRGRVPSRQIALRRREIITVVVMAWCWSRTSWSRCWWRWRGGLLTGFRLCRGALWDVFRLLSLFILIFPWNWWFQAHQWTALLAYIVFDEFSVIGDHFLADPGQFQLFVQGSPLRWG